MAASLSSVPRGNPAASLRRNPAAPWRHLDLALVGATLAVAALGVLTVYSATRTTAPDAGISSTYFLVRQLAWVTIGIVVMAVLQVVDYRRYHDVAPPLYVGGIVLLVAVLTPLGASVNGSDSWFAVGSLQLQPAELVKLASLLLLAGIASTAPTPLSGRVLVACLGVVGVPAALILLQPDVGSAMVYGALALVVLVVAGASSRHLAVLALVGVVGVIGVFQLDLIEPYQKDRLTEFANPDGTSAASYNATQAQTAIGAGGLTGAGPFQGTQTKLRYVPEQQTDFIFTVVGEELGFVGSGTLLALYAVMVWRIWRAAAVARDAFGTLVCTGVFAIVLFQVFENMGMAMGIMPITGLPLPFMSYGGSSTITMFAAVGLVLNVHTRRFS